MNSFPIDKIKTEENESAVIIRNHGTYAGKYYLFYDLELSGVKSRPKYARLKISEENGFDQKKRTKEIFLDKHAAKALIKMLNEFYRR